MKTEPDVPEADPHATCTGNCGAAAEDSKKAFGVRGAVIAGSLGLALSACNSKPAVEPGRMTMLYGPAPMLKQIGSAQARNAVKEAPKPKKAE